MNTVDFNMKQIQKTKTEMVRDYFRNHQYMKGIHKTAVDIG